MFKEVKLLTLKLAKSLSAFDLVGRSSWRRDRLLIIAYHGVSQRDEHLWNPGLYITPEQFCGRMEALKESGCNVLPLAPALQMLSAGKLPEKSVAITFDDGFYSFYRLAFPIIKEFGWPVTVYLTSYYSGFNRPVFDVMCSYLLWKGGGQVIDGGRFTNNGNLDLRSEKARSAAALAIRSFARESRLSAVEKDDLLTSLAGQLGVDYEALLAERILHLLSPAEVAELGKEGVDIQLHTHRHCAPPDRRLLHELEQNRHFIKELTDSSASHFCYPSGVYDPRHFLLLHEAKVVSATTCQAGLASRDTNPLALPRLTDTSSLHEVEFEGWLCGISDFLPRRSVQDDEIISPYYY